MKVAVIGAGSLGQAIIEAMQKRGIKDIIASRRSKANLAVLKKRFGIEVTTDNIAASKEADVIILTVRPDVVDEVVKEISTEKLIISVVAAKPIKTIKAKRVARVMTSLLVFDEIAWFTCNDEDEKIIKKIFGENSIRVKEEWIDVRSCIGMLTGVKPMIAEQEIKELMKFNVDKKILEETYGAMFSAIGKKMQKGFSGEDLFNGCTGGHKGSFTYGFYSSIEKEIDKIKTSLSETVQKMRDRK